MVLVGDEPMHLGVKSVEEVTRLSRLQSLLVKELQLQEMDAASNTDAATSVSSTIYASFSN